MCEFRPLLRLPPAPPPAGSPLRVRPSAHLVDEEYLAKYERAVALMKALPDDDPRSFAQQWRVHCAYCDAAYDQVGFPDLDLQIHNCWLFFPWHWYSPCTHASMRKYRVSNNALLI